MKSTSVYTETVDTLKTLLGKSKSQYNKTFWSENDGRYHLGINKDGDVVDYGFTMYNQEAVLYGLADTVQAEQIQSWINGDRNIATDDSKGKDLYVYEFAPRWSTKNNKVQFWWRFNGTQSKYRWKEQIQNGGVAIHQAYYDLAATQQVNGTEKAFTKLNNIKDWYSKVAKANGKGENFYINYYTKYTTPNWALQGGSKGAGAIGLDTEFLEAAIMYTSIPDVFFGLSSTEYKTLNIAPALPGDLTFWKMENLTYSKLVYDLSIGKNFVQINSIRGEADGEKVKVTLDKPDGNFEVRQHNTLLVENIDYVISGDKVIITAPFKNGRIQILEK